MEEVTYNLNENGVVLNADKFLWYKDPKGSYREVYVKFAYIGGLYYTAVHFMITGQGCSGPVSPKVRGYVTLQEAVNKEITFLKRMMERIILEGTGCACNQQDLVWVKKTLPLVLSHHKVVNNFSSYIYTL